MITHPIGGPVPRSLFLLVLLALSFPAVSHAQPDPALGTWKLNTEKSKFAPGTAPTNTTVTIEAAGQAFKVTTRTVRVSGKVIRRITPRMSTDDYPVEGSPDYDTVSLKRNGATVEGTRKQNGKVVQMYQRVISEDRKTMTVATTGKDASGQTLNSITVYDRR